MIVGESEAICEEEFDMAFVYPSIFSIVMICLNISELNGKGLFVCISFIYPGRMYDLEGRVVTTPAVPMSGGNK